MNSVKKYLSLIKFSHTVFALPFAIIGFCLAIHSGKVVFNWEKLFLVVGCMVFARSAAMAFNRYIDRSFDAKNPRTAIREIPAGQIKPKSAAAFTLVSAALFMASAYFINHLCFYLSPVALLVVLGYSFTKRFTPFCHLILGLGLSLAPIGAYLALTERFDVLPILFSVVVFFWVGGFDIIFALQDEEFDRSEGLKSIPVLMGKAKALRLSEFMHLIAASIVIIAFFYGGFSWLYIGGAVVFIGLLIYQHLIVKPDDLSRVNLAFGTSNGIASVIFSLFVCLDIFLL
ncbi:MAG TPA: UbiA-like polyprenyltransferase [Bacteroidia bacterium]|nr:UbiA-like polyprenyltransferase [Bacteroidia bacterium]